jgi:protein-S-isoprenylcysteine O-methyltransferase Ste14
VLDARPAHVRHKLVRVGHESDLWGSTRSRTWITSSNVTSGVIKRAIQIVLSGIILAVFTLVPAGRLDWWAAWAYVAIFSGAVIFNVLFVLGKDPELIAERGETKENTKGWDKTVTNFITVVTLFTLVVAGLDARFDWSQVGLAIQIGGLTAVVAGYGIAIWAMAANRFFARVVRIQQDRGHAVCSSGPYRFVRHPGYVGMCVYSFATPFALGSWWAIVPALFIVIGFVIRTSLEDRTLQAELAGYAEYAARVRYRLVPGIW